MDAHDQPRWSEQARERLAGLLHGPRGGGRHEWSSNRSRRSERRRSATWSQRLSDPDPLVVLEALGEAKGDPSLDCSLAASHPDPVVRLAAAAVWVSLDQAARERLRADPVADVAASSSPELLCRAFVDREDVDDHARMFGTVVHADERITVAAGTLGRRGQSDEVEHVGCVLAAVDLVVAGLCPDETRLAERAATVAAAAVRSVGVEIPLADERLWPLGLRLAGDAAAAWQARLIALSTRPADWDWDGSRERALRQRSNDSAAQQFGWDEARRLREAEWERSESERAERLRRGEYPALRRDRNDRTGQSEQREPRRQKLGF